MADSFGYTPRVAVSADERAALVRFAETTVRAAGAVTLPHFRSGTHIDNKLSDGFDPVTEADRGAEQVIRDAIEQAYPAHGILGEEFGHKPGNGLTWVIDPIDGTRAFMSGMLHWGVLLGLFDGEEAIVGAMYQPYVDECFSGDSDTAWFTRGDARRTMHTSTCTTLDQATLATTGPNYFQGEAATQFERLRDAARMTRLGGDCYVHAMVAMGGVDIGTDASLNPYDIAALIPIIRGAGGVITTYDGDNAAMGGTVLASANTTLHQRALDLIQQTGESP